MPEVLACSQCGRALPPDASGGWCSECLLRRGPASTDQGADATLASSAGAERTGEFVEAPEKQNARSILAPNATGDWTAAKSTATGAWTGTPSDTSDGPPTRTGPVLFGNYELQEELGRGGMGVVFRAVQAVARREVAVKILLGGAAGDALHGGRFAAEVSALANLRHPNIVTVFEVGEVGGSAFFSMEYAPNGTLSGRLKRGPMPFSDAAVLIGKLAEATEAAHRLGVLHRDIKPGNVLIGADGEPKLSDFGLAKWVNRDEGRTAAGVVVGTPSYMAPEQARGANDIGPAADVYALGATLYECLTGRPPFRGADTYAVIRRVLTAEPDSPCSIRRDVPTELEAISLKCLDKDPAKRYRTAQELADDLKRWCNGESTVARPLKRRQRAWRHIKRNWKPLSAAVVLLGAVGIALAVIPRQGKLPVAEIEEALKRGETVTLIGAGGRPKYQRWVYGVGETGDVTPTQPLIVVCRAGGMLELTPDSHNDRFRLSAEFHQDESLTPSSTAGIYFSHKIGTPGPAGCAERVSVIEFQDNLIDNAPVFGTWDPLTLTDQLVVRTETEPFKPVSPKTLRTHLVKETKPETRTRPWRKVVVEVTPDAISVYWRNAEGKMELIRNGPVSADEFRRCDKEHAAYLRNHHPGIEFAGLEHSPRGGVGLFLRDSRVLFRNVVLEPLKP